MERKYVHTGGSSGCGRRALEEVTQWSSVATPFVTGYTRYYSEDSVLRDMQVAVPSAQYKMGSFC